MEFIDANRDDVVEGARLGVEPIVTVLRDAGVAVAPSSYYAHKTRPASKRALRDKGLVVQLTQIWVDNYSVYGVRKLHKAARRAGLEIGRDQCRRLMRQAGLRGVTRAKTVKTTRPDPAAARHPDLVQRDFTATSPNQLWVTDLTYVPTWAGVAYVCFITDVYSRMIVGWRVANHMRTDMVLDAIEMARWNRGLHHTSLRCHSDAGSVHLDPLWRTTRRDRRHPIDRHRRRLLRQRPGRERERLLQSRADPRPCPPRPVEDRRGRRARDPGLGLLAQHQPPPQLPRRSPADRIRAGVLRCPTQ